MKKQFIICISIGSLLWGCGTKELKKEQAVQLIRKKFNFPRTVEGDIYCGDPRHASRLIDKGIETAGMVTVQRTQKLKDIGKPLVHFTEKAKPYLLLTPEKDRKILVQKVRVASEDVTEIELIKNGESMVVGEFTTVYSNFTPFVKLIDPNPGRKRPHYVIFRKNADGNWRIEKAGQ